MTDDAIKRWLSGKPLKDVADDDPRRGCALSEWKAKMSMTRFYSSFEELDEILCPNGLNPYDRAMTEKVDLDLLYECLSYMSLTGMALPSVLIVELQNDIDLLRSRREARILKPESGKPLIHPEDDWRHALIISYVESANRNGWDKHPMKTIEEKLGVRRSSYKEWKDRGKPVILLQSKTEMEGLLLYLAGEGPFPSYCIDIGFFPPSE